MKRRQFFKQTIPTSIMLPALINGFSVKAHNAHSALVQTLSGACLNLSKAHETAEPGNKQAILKHWVGHRYFVALMRPGYEHAPT